MKNEFLLTTTLIKGLVLIFAVLGVGAGLLLREVVRQGDAAAAQAASSPTTAPSAAARVSTASREDRLALTPVAVMPPPDPFAPLGPPPPAPAVSRPAQRMQIPAGARPAQPEPGYTPAAAAPSAPVQAASSPQGLPDDLVVTGIVDGERPLAVIQMNGATLFLKIGDTVADTWVLDEIGQRSVVLRSGASKRTFAIQGGG